jgi:uncharacterized membrane protein YbhN (UPF0104 family)
VILIQIIGSISLVLITHFLSETLSLCRALLANSTAFFLGAVSMIPMGLGVREASVLVFLNQLGIPQASGLAVVTVQRLLSTGLSFALGVVFGALLGLRQMHADEDHEQAGRPEEMDKQGWN